MSSNHIINNKIILRKIINKKYNYQFLDIFKEYIDIEKYYNILQYINLKNLINLINIKWLKIQNIIDKDNIIYKDNTIYKVNDCNNELFNKILIKFIKNEYAICIFVINCIIKYIS